jgi:hypothetical protein
MANFFDQVGDFAKDLGNDLTGKTAKEIALSQEKRKSALMSELLNDDGSANTGLIVGLVVVVLIIIAVIVWILTKKTV